MIEFLAGVGTGVVVLLAFFRWLWTWLEDRHIDNLIERGPCAHCRRLLEPGETEHWRTCPKHPARFELERMRAKLAEYEAML